MKPHVLVLICLLSFGTGKKTFRHSFIGNSQPTGSSAWATYPGADPYHIAENMVRIEGGTYTMGCTAEQGRDCSTHETPTHVVTLTSFYLNRYEVTQAQWRAVTGSNPSYHTDCDNCPVEMVSWKDIQLFITELNSQTGKHYRLPTEAEWEYAARGGSKSKSYKYSGSNDLNSVAWHTDNSGSKTHPVGQKQVNELGLYDMSGNVWEWCSDWYNAGYYSASAKQNPAGPVSGPYRVVRGSCWNLFNYFCRVAFRSRYLPDNRNNSFGFRLAATEF